MTTNHMKISHHKAKHTAEGYTSVPNQQYFYAYEGGEAKEIQSHIIYKKPQNSSASYKNNCQKS